MLSALFIPFPAYVISSVHILCFQPVSSALCILFSVCVISGLSYQHCSHCFQFVLSALFTPFLANVISTVYTFFCLCYHHCSHSFQPVLSALFTLFSACAYGSGCSKEVKSGSSCSQKYTCNNAIYDKSSPYSISQSDWYYGLSFKVFSGYTCGNTGQ